jgi:hypothetical protein
MSVWALRFLMFFVCILYTQPQNRFIILHPLHIADIAVAGAVGFHVLACAQEGRPLLRMGPATVLTLLLIFSALISQYTGVFMTWTGWNSYIDILMKASLVLLLTEAMCYSVQRVWAMQAVVLFATLWWVKAGLRLSAAGATYAGDRIMGPAVSLIENPNGFAYMMAVVIPIYLYFFQQVNHKYIRWAFLGLALAAVYIVLETGSRTGYLLLLCIGAFVVPHYFWRHKTALLVAVIGIFVVSSSVGALNIERFKSIPKALMAALSGEVKQAGEIDQDAQSAQERSLKNRDTWRLIKAYPLGVGMNPDESQYGEIYPYAVGQVHCEILMAGKQMGFVGMGIYLGMIGMVFVNGWRVQRKCAKTWPAVADLGWTLKIQAIGFLVGGAFSPLPFNTPMMILVACGSALWGLVKSEEFMANAPGTASAASADAAPVPSK